MSSINRRNAPKLVATALALGSGAMLAYAAWAPVRAQAVPRPNPPAIAIIQHAVVHATAATTCTCCCCAMGGEQRCSRCGNMGAVCEAGCGHTPATCKCKTFTADKGPDRIDPQVLANYAPYARETYTRVFSQRCSKCHTLARPINTNLAPTEWQKYIKKMMRKPGSGISVGDGKRVWEYLVYDLTKRKKGFFEALPAAEKQIAMNVAAEVEKGK